jgi:hypothetical protein
VERERLSSISNEINYYFRPIFIVHEADNGSNKNGIAEAMCQQRKNMEINNNEKSPYLHEREDKSDNLIPTCDDNMQAERDKGILTASGEAKGGCPCISSEKVNETIESSRRSDSDKGMSMSSKSDSDECAKFLLNERTMEPDERQQTIFNRIESAKSVINNGPPIKSDSERLDGEEISSFGQNNAMIASHDDDDDVCEMRQSADDDDDGESFLFFRSQISSLISIE